MRNDHEDETAERVNDQTHNTEGHSTEAHSAEAHNTEAHSAEAHNTEAHNTASTRRRTFLKLASSTGLALGGLGFATSGAVAQDGGPPNQSNWSLMFEDQFGGGTLGDAWEVGWGWGTVTDTSRTRIVSENTNVSNDRLQLTGTHDGNNVLSGGINTRNSVTFGPGSYVEAKLKFAAREGFHPAFWAKPNSGAWPPEVDIVECIQNGGGRDDTHTSRHFLHYSASTEPGDNSTHERLRQFYEPGGNLTTSFHVYGVEWQSDGISIYVDNQEVVRWTNSGMLQSMANGAPFYINLAQNINVDTELNEYLGTANLSQPWGETTEAEWVRVWQQ